MFNGKLVTMKNHLNKINSTDIILLLILFIGSFLRLYRLNFKGLWLDELSEVIVAESSTINGVLSGVSQHLSPPLDYIILHFFLLFGNNDFIARLPSAIFGILSIMIIYNVAKSLFGIKEGLISALLLSLSPLHIWYSQEARMYSLFMLLSLLSILFFYKAIVENDKKMWYGFIISTALNLYTHYFAFFMILIYFIFLCILIFKTKYHAADQILSNETYKTALLYFIYSILVIFLLFIPQISVFLTRLSGDPISFGLPPTSYFFGIIFYKMGGWSIFSLLIYAGFFTYGLLQILKIANRNQMMLLILWLATPLILIFTLTFIRGPMAADRYFIFTLPAFIVIVSKGIVCISYSINHWMQKYNQYKLNNYIIVLIFTSLIVGVTFTGATIDNLYNFQNKGDKDTGLYLTEYTKNDDLIVHFNGIKDNVHRSDIEYYYNGPADIISIAKNASSASNIINSTSVEEYNRVWFIYSEIDSGIYRGFNDNLSVWLNNHCDIERNGPMLNRFSLSNVDKKIIDIFNVEFHENFKGATLYTFDLKK